MASGQKKELANYFGGDDAYKKPDEEEGDMENKMEGMEEEKKDEPM